MATDMLERVAAGARPVCSHCGHVFRTKLPPALLVLTPTDQQLRSIGGELCRRCLRSGDPLAVLEAAFDQVLPGLQIEAVQ